MAESTSDTGNGFSTEEPLVKKSRLPDNTAFKQQKLPAWQPILTAKSILPGFFVIACIFIPIGYVLLISSGDVVEVTADYTTCFSLTAPFVPCANIRKNASLSHESCICKFDLNVNKNMSGDIYVYYGLSNFYQNHRRYVASRDNSQLNGVQKTTDTISSSCASFKLDDGKPIAPCGAIANSLFNDTFTFSSITITRTGIAWNTDHTVKFKNPTDENDPNNLTAAFMNYAKPKYWQKRVEELDPLNVDNNGYKNEALEVWMRTAAFPTFRKPYGKLNTNNLQAGRYNVDINYDFPVTSFGGTKKIILSTTSWMGGRNDFLAIAYMVVGSLSLTACFVLTIVHRMTTKKSPPGSPSSIS